MFEKDKIAIDLDSTNIKIMVGNRKKVKYFEIIKTPEDSIKDEKIIDVVKIKDALQLYFDKNNIKVKNVAFTIHGQDVVSRHTEVPIMDATGIKTSLDFEMNQYLPKSAEEYIIDYEIIEKIDSAQKKALKLFVVAVPKEKINKIMDICKMLKFNIVAIDISSNCTRRVFKDISKNNGSLENIGVIDLGSDDTNIIILDKGKLFNEREIPFGVNNIIKEIVRRENIDGDNALNYLKNNINLTGSEEGSELEKRILNLFDSVFSSLGKIVAFFTIGRAKDNLDAIYIIGSGHIIRGLQEYSNTYFNCPVFILDSTKNIGIKTVIPTDCDIRYYIGTLGLLLRKE